MEGVGSQEPEGLGARFVETLAGDVAECQKPHCGAVQRSHVGTTGIKLYITD